MDFKSVSLIPGYEAFTNYEINSTGTLRRTTDCHNAKKGHLNKWRVDKHGYIGCSVYSSGKGKHILQHRAICFLFIPNPNNHKAIDHINGIRNDNRIENLRWASVAENRHNSVKHHSKNGQKHIYKGVITNKYDTSFYYWIVDIVINGKHNRKHFKCSEHEDEPPAEVITFRDKKVAELHGEFACQRELRT
jgi:hypothetical protein